MLERYFGLIEAAFVFSLAVAFYVWQRRDLKREAEKAKERESEEKSRSDADE